MKSEINGLINTRLKKYVIFHLFLILVTFVLNSEVLNYFVILMTCLITSFFLPSLNPINRFAGAFVLLIGLSPFYLVFRGFVTSTMISRFDFQIYLLVFLILNIFTYLFSKKSKKSILVNLSRTHLKVVMASLVGLLIIATAEVYLMTKSVGDAVAWIASGDSKNHFVNSVQLVGYGNLDPKTFITQPVSAPAFLTLLLGQVSTVDISNAQILSAQIQVYAHFWVILIGFTGVTMAAIAEFIWNSSSRKTGEIPKFSLAVVSMTPLISLIVGSATYDGFFTALFGISTLCVMTVWFFESFWRSNFSSKFLIYGFLFFLTSLMAWMFVIPVTFLMLMLGIRNQLFSNFSKSRFIDIGLVACLLIVYLSVHFSEFGQNLIYKAKLALSATGAVNVNNPSLFFGLIAIITFVALTYFKFDSVFRTSLLSLAAIQLIALFAFKLFSNLSPFSWNYYLLKYQWIMVSVLAGLIISIFISIFVLNQKLSKPKIFLTSALLYLIIFTFSESLVTTNRMWQRAMSGWQNPTSAMMNKVLEQEIDYKNPTMFFHYGYAGNATLGNFWINAFAEPIEPIKGWNYTIDTAGDPKQLCELNAYYPTVTVITSDAQLEAQLKQACPDEKFEIKFNSPVW